MWDVSSGSATQQSIVLLDSGLCKTLVRRAASEAVIASVEKTIHRIHRLESKLPVLLNELRSATAMNLGKLLTFLLDKAQRKVGCFLLA